MSSHTYERTRSLMEADIGDELVALDPQAGHCFGFNGVAAAVWRALETPKSFDELRDALLSEYDVDRERCSLELQQLLADMTAKGLVASSGQQV